MYSWLRLVRWPNLLIIALTQFVAWWCVVYRLPVQHVLSPQNFVLLCLSTVLIAAGGYIINDYFDVRIDVINKPEKVVLEREIPRKLAIIVHSVLNVVALGLAAIIAIPAGHPEWLLLQLVCTGLLWRYSTTWKRQFMIGNVVVALMTALTIVALIIYEPALQGTKTVVLPGWHTIIYNPLPPSLCLGVFALFAFLLTWMREIVKDMEDYKGDDAEGCVTMPIKWGLLKSIRFTQGLGLIAVAVLASVPFSLRASPARYFLWYFIPFCIILPILGWIFRLSTAATTTHFHKASTQLKWIMVAGIVSFVVISLLIQIPVNVNNG
jgi:4-hydroxybenzoate polyprenyltransferase